MMKYTIVTGAASDIGLAVCRKLVNDGHTLLMLDIDEAPMIDFISQLSDKGEHRYLKVDLSNAEVFGPYLEDYLRKNAMAVGKAVFAAGIFSIIPLRMMTHDVFSKVFDVSVFSSLRILQILNSKRINGSNLESVVFISSISARLGIKGYSLYGAAKASILGIVHSLAAELAPQVRVNAILPGGIRTRATAFIYDASDSVDSRLLLGVGNPADIADAVSFLLSDSARWITGQEIVVDGGYTSH